MTGGSVGLDFGNERFHQDRFGGESNRCVTTSRKRRRKLFLAQDRKTRSIIIPTPNQSPRRNSGPRRNPKAMRPIPMSITAPIQISQGRSSIPTRRISGLLFFVGPKNLKMAAWGDLHSVFQAENSPGRGLFPDHDKTRPATFRPERFLMATNVSAPLPKGRRLGRQLKHLPNLHHPLNGFLAGAKSQPQCALIPAHPPSQVDHQQAQLL